MGAEQGKAGLLKIVAVEEVVCVERDDASGVGVGNVDARLTDGAKVEAVGVDELNDEDAEEVLIG